MSDYPHKPDPKTGETLVTLDGAPISYRDTHYTAGGEHRAVEHIIEHLEEGSYYAKETINLWLGYGAIEPQSAVLMAQAERARKHRERQRTQTAERVRQKRERDAEKAGRKRRKYRKRR